MQKWGALPTEILIHVIFLVGKNDNAQERMDDLSQCALACRNWREIAQPILFSKTTLKDFETASENLCQLLMNNDRLGIYVKELKSDSGVCRATSLITMDSLFPNLERIELDWGEGDIYPFFCKLITKGRFCNLTFVPFLTFYDYEFADMYLECILTLKAQITKVYLLDDASEGGFSKFLRMCDKLYNFPKLQSVYIGQFYDDDDDEFSQTIMDYVEPITAQQDNLMRLEKIRIELDDPDCSPLPLEKIHTIQPSTKIKDISMPMNSSYGGQFIILLYIMKKFPSLRRIELFFDLWIMNPTSNDFLTQEYARQRSTATLQFLQYLCQIQDCDVSNISVLENPASLIRDLLLQVKIKPPCIHITYVKPYGCMRHNSRLIKALINVKKNVIDGEHTVSVKFNKEPVAEFEQLHLNLFQEAGRLFTELTLETNTSDEFISGINYIGKYCHQLEKLEIRARNLPKGDSLTTLEGILDGVKNYSVKELRVSASKLTLNQIISISAQFQCLENLIIDNFLLASWRNFTTIDDKKHQSICLNKNCSLKYININTANDESDVFPGLSGIHVNVTTDSSQNSCVSLSTKTKDRVEKTLRLYSDPLREDKNMSSSAKDKNWVTYHIHCKSIEKLDIVFPTTVTKYGKEREVLQTHTLTF